MFRQYDSDNTVWSPQGRLYQIEYAMGAVKKGSATVGLRSKTHAIVGSLNRSPHKLAGYQKKVFCIDEHVGIGISGLTADARMISEFMRTECLNHRFVYESAMPVNRLSTMVADISEAQVHTQRYGRRPYGVGLLVAGYDMVSLYKQTGPHLYENCPSGSFLEYKAMAIGARSQACKTYLERTFESFGDATREELLKHAVTALREGAASKDEEEFTAEALSVGIVGPDEKFHLLSLQEVQDIVNSLEALPTAEESDEEDEQMDV